MRTKLIALTSAIALACASVSPAQAEDGYEPTTVVPGLTATVEPPLPRGAAPLALIAFGMGRAAYGGVLLAVAAIGVAYVRSWAAVRRALWPVADAPVDRETAALVRVTTAQALLKLLLTEGDKLAVAQLTTLEDQGGYALASNYGSLVARTLFQPVEESARLEFSRVGGRDGGAGEPATSAAAALLTALLLGSLASIAAAASGMDVGTASPAYRLRIPESRAPVRG